MWDFSSKGRVWNNFGVGVILKTGRLASLVVFPTAMGLTWSVIGPVAGCIISPWCRRWGVSAIYQHLQANLSRLQRLCAAGADYRGTRMQVAQAHIQTLIHSMFKRCNCHVGGDWHAVMRTQASTLHRKADGLITERNTTKEPWMEHQFAAFKPGKAAVSKSPQAQWGRRSDHVSLHFTDIPAK